MPGDKMRILVLAPHGDDGTLGCGGTIARSIEEGYEVFYMAFCTRPKTSLRTIRGIQELRRASGILGIKSANLIFYSDLEIRSFADQRQLILDQMVSYNKKILPDTVFCPSLSDNHQDHRVIAEEACRAFKRCSILGYELPWNHVALTPHLNFFVVLTEAQLDTKIKALKCSVSQKGKDYMTAEFQRSLARVRGLPTGARHAEAFEMIRWIAK